MKKLIIFVILIIAFYSCNKPDKNSKNTKIIYKSVNKEFVLIRDVQLLQESNDEISNHVDSIINGQLNAEFISTGHKEFFLDFDTTLDIAFEIIDLNKYNQNNLPDTLDSLAARVIPVSVEILDNSTYGYPDALNTDDEISDNGNWTSNIGVLGTFMNAGKFQGQGEKYIAFRLLTNNNFKYGWIKIYCSSHNDTLRIIDYAYNDIENSKINAGQKE